MYLNLYILEIIGLYLSPNDYSLIIYGKKEEIFNNIYYYLFKYYFENVKTFISRSQNIFSSNILINIKHGLLIGIVLNDGIKKISSMKNYIVNKENGFQLTFLYESKKFIVNLKLNDEPIYQKEYYAEQFNVPNILKFLMNSNESKGKFIILREGSYVNGKKDGEWKYYETTGDLKSKEIYSSGKLINIEMMTIRPISPISSKTKIIEPSIETRMIIQNIDNKKKIELYRDFHLRNKYFSNVVQHNSFKCNFFEKGNILNAEFEANFIDNKISCVFIRYNQDREEIRYHNEIDINGKNLNFASNILSYREHYISPSNTNLKRVLTIEKGILSDKIYGIDTMLLYSRNAIFSIITENDIKQFLIYKNLLENKEKIHNGAIVTNRNNNFFELIDVKGNKYSFEINPLNKILDFILSNSTDISKENPLGYSIRLATIS